MEKYQKKKIEVNTLECLVCESRDVLGIPVNKPNADNPKEQISYIALLCKNCFNLETMLMTEYQEIMQSP